MIRFSLFQGALLASLGLHAAAVWALRLERPQGRSRAPIEIDLTRPAPPPGPPSGKALTRAGVPPSLPRALSGDAPPQPLSMPGPGTPKAEPESPGSPLAGEEDGAGGRGRVVLPPALADKRGFQRDLRRFYPEEERRAGRQADLVVDMHIDARGRVSSFEIVRSAGAAFDAAASRIIPLLRFSPARTAAGPVAVKVRQTIEFRLD